MGPTAPKFLPLGDSALQIVFGDRLDPAVSRYALALSQRVKNLSGLTDRVPAYASLTLHYDPQIWTHAELVESLKALLGDVDCETDDGETLTVPICYGGEYGPDLDEVAQHTGLSPDEVVTRHSGGLYRVHFIGFMPGFPYLGGLDPALSTPRRAEPRTLVPAGSVGIAGDQTGIYPLASPGGWRIIGRTPLRLFDPGRDPPCLLSPGDRIRFVPTGPEEFARECAETRQ
ncbi:5-oxoprolinase subunit PxpB [Methylococcus sp. EFPC2]|uniref:5-oxoprolinase subunit PxpB n=1 Tax=Methylococcus sp. EFPC2 TaxID=2812648 RepID=UPI0019682145|nr:5-oxoprolinase subunit PxpB [Methylococcus sp. EFPC2]QSA96026.1 5-oxoprolinase subunit PxpB [Methylococcus sp. EFPC2]